MCNFNVQSDIHELSTDALLGALESIASGANIASKLQDMEGTTINLRVIDGANNQDVADQEKDALGHLDFPVSSGELPNGFACFTHRNSDGSYTIVITEQFLKLATYQTASGTKDETLQQALVHELEIIWGYLHPNDPNGIVSFVNGVYGEITNRDNDNQDLLQSFPGFLQNNSGINGNVNNPKLVPRATFDTGIHILKPDGSQGLAEGENNPGNLGRITRCADGPIQKARPKVKSHLPDANKETPPTAQDPLVFDLTGAGIQTTAFDVGTFFDFQNNGFAEKTAWIGSGTGILVNDPTGGPITNGSQLFSTATSLSGGGYAVDGFDALADLDSNTDGVINSSDTHWSDLRMWVDNGNGVVDSGELETMSAAGVASISLSTTNTNTTDANGNYIGKTATYSLVGGGTREVADVSLLTDPADTFPDTTVTLDGTVSLLPDIDGAGTVTSLQQAMQSEVNASNTTLEGYVQSFVAATDDATRNTLVDEIIYEWTGVAGVSPTARGSYFDARQLEALEKFSGQAFIDPYNSTSNPGSQSVSVLTTVYKELHDQILAALEIQTDLASLFDGLGLSYDSLTGTVSDDYSSIETDILDDLSSNRLTGLATLADFNQAMHALGLDTDSGFATFRSDLIAQGDDVAATFLGGTPIVYGTAASDVITAWAGNQTIIASQGGNDTLIGSGDNETFFGSGGSNVFIGGVGNNEVFQGGSNGGTDTFIAGQGTETFREGFQASAIAHYAAGDGHLSLQIDSGQGTLVLDSSIARSDVSLSSRGLSITDGTSGDLITQNSRFYFRTLTFDDGTTINLANSGGTHAATGGSTLSNGNTDDIYVYTPGAGHVTISDTGGNNEIWFGGTIGSGNISLTTSGNDLLITDGVTGDQIKDVNYGVQTVRFADGSTLDLLSAGSTYTLSGGTTSVGSPQYDVFVFNSGTGTATISDPSGNNTLSFGTGILSGSLAFTASGNDLLITDGVSGDKIIVQDQLSGRNVMSMATFSGNGTMALTGVALSEASGASSLNGTTGGDTLLSNSGSQTLNGNGGNDIYIVGIGNTTASGGIGNDTYSFASGSGLLTVDDTGGRDTLQLGTGISSVTLTASGHDLVITDGVSGDTITLLDQLDTQIGVETLRFSGGTTQSLLGIALTANSSILYGTPSDDTLTATSGTETLFGDAGNDTFVGASGTESLMGNGWNGNNLFIVGSGVTTAYGGSGDDIYSYSSGSGLLTVNEEGGLDTIALGTGLSSVTLAASGHDLVLTDGVGGDTITLKNQLTTTQGVEMLTYAGGGSLVLTGIALTANAASLYGTAGDDTLTAASSSTETITGNGGADIYIDATGSHTFVGGTGNDTHSYHSGDGLLTITETGGINTVKLGSGISTASVTMTESGHDLLITDGVGGDTITLKNQMSTNLVITNLVFNDGTTWVLEGMALTASGSTLYGTEGNDTLTATTGTQTLIGNGGNDTFIGATGAVRMTGASGNDSFMGGTGSQTMTGGGGNDYFHNGGGTDTMTGSTGNDTFVGGSGVASMASGGGSDTFIAGGGTAIVTGATGNNIYSFGSGNGQFTITDTAGTDTLRLGSGLTSANVSLSEATNGHDLLILDGTGGDQVDIIGHITGNMVETLVYGDASTLNLTTSLKITAASGTATLNGTSGNDTLYGSTGTQSINGGGGTDTFVGGTGTQTLNGSSGANNVFIAGSGSQTALGSTSNDTYSYAATDGLFTISDTGGTDTLKLASGLTSANVSLSESTNGQDLWILDGTGGDKITIDHGVAASFSADRIEKLIYGDGSTLSLTGTTGLTLNAQTGSSTLIAWTTGNNTLIATSGASTETLKGNSGNDTYSYDSGTGVVVVDEGGNGGTDTLKLGTGLTSANISYTESSNGNDLIVTDGVAGDTIILKNDIKSASSQVEKIIYGDGSTANLSGIVLTAATGNTTLTGTAGNDILVGTVGNQTIKGNGGTDVFNAGTGTQTLDGSTNTGSNVFFTGSGTVTARGHSGGDIYHFASGAGVLRVDESASSGAGTDTLLLDDLNSGSVTLSADSNGLDLLITDGISGDQISINHQIAGSFSSYFIEKLQYADGSTLNLVTGNLVINLASGNTTLADTAMTGNNTYIATAGAGTETVRGGSGSDVYSYHNGDGGLFINEVDGGTDTLKLGSGINPYNAFFGESTNGANLIITDQTSGDTITVNLHVSTSVDRVEKLVFDDGTTFDLTTTVGKNNTTSTVNGTSGADILICNTNNQTLAGLGGSDRYYFGTGEGQDKINNGVSTANNAAGTLYFGHGIGDDELWFDRVNDTGTISSSGNNLRIIIMGTTSSMTVNGWYIGGSSTYKQLSEFQLTDDGLMLDSQLSNLVSAMSTFEANYLSAHGTAFDPTAVSSITDTAVLSAVSSDWHS